MILNRYEVTRSVIQLSLRLIRGFLVPVALGEISYAIYLKIVSLFRFSSLTELGLREWVIKNAIESNGVSLKYIFGLNLLFTAPSIALSFLFGLSTLETLTVLLFWFSFNLRYILSNMYPFKKDWTGYLKFETSIFIITVLFLLVYRENLRVANLLILDIVISIYITLIFYKIMNPLNSRVGFIIKMKNYVKTIQEFFIGNADAISILLVSSDSRPSLGIYFGIGGMFLYFGEATINTLIISKTRLRYVSLIIGGIVLLFLLVFILGFTSVIKELFDWVIFDNVLLMLTAMNLLLKLSYSFLRKKYLIHSINKIETKMMQLFTIGTLVSLICFYYFF